MRRHLYINMGNVVSLRVACLPKALVTTSSFVAWRPLAKASLRSGVRLYLIDDDSPIRYRTIHALRRVRPGYRTLSVAWLDHGRRPLKSFLNAHAAKRRLAGLPWIPAVGSLEGEKPRYRYDEAFIEGRRLRLSDLHDPALVDEIGRCLLAVAQHETTACLVHGDPHFRNFLLRRRDHRLFLIDFDSAFDGPFLFDVLYFMVRVLNYASAFEVDASNSVQFTAIFRGLVRPFRSSMRFGSRVDAGELAIQWRYVSSHFSRKWGESHTNERFQKIIAAWSETLSISLFDNGCA